MLASNQIEALICEVAEWDRPELIRQLADFRAPFPVDFTTDYLQAVSLDRLRHVFVALCLQSQSLPEMAVSDGVAA